MGDWLPPLVQRDLLGYSRKAWTYWLRFLTTLLAISVLAVIAFIRHNRLSQNDGIILFVPLAVVLIIVVSLTGLRSTSDSISRERREGTLGLLFLTDLRVSTILFSKLLSHSVQNVCALLAVLPVLGICVLLGGVSGRLFAQAVLAVLAALWLALAIGLHESCVHEEDHLAFAAGLRKIFGFNLIPLVSPFSLMVVSFWQDVGAIIYYWAALVCSVLLGLRYWLGAQTALKLNWQKAGTIAPAPAVVPPMVGHLKRPPKLCGSTEPALWIISRYGDFRQASPRGIAWAFLIGFVGMAALIKVQGARADSIGLLYLGTMGIARFVQLLAMAKIAPQSFADITGQGALEILQTTPVTLRQLVEAATRFLRRQFAAGIIPMLIFDVGMFFFISTASVTRLVDEPMLLASLAAQEILFLAALPAVAYTGMWFGLRCGSFSAAVFRTTLLTVVLPPLGFFAGDILAVTTTLTLFYLALAAWMWAQVNRLLEGGDSLLKVLYR